MRRENWMRITPMDIEQQEFSRSFRGYNEEEVDDFLDKIVKDYEELINENVRLNEEIEKMKERLKEFSEIEESLKGALLNAQKSAEEIKGRIENEAKVMVKKAEIEAEVIKQKASQKEDESKNEINNLRRYKFMFKEKFKSMLNLYLKMLESEEFEEQGDYKITEKLISEDKIKEIALNRNIKIEKTENEQPYK
ncbi:MAG: septum formation initiator [Candidatus Infernicultor aquiphilus]|uniref:Septum formation initiator n=2 Tax=Candidatus Infernicultor aquiphilus TaxID=1805029 RepID=A0A2M8CDJ2_9BACT|nr:MAG: septum formation initiator [Candidatus Atribacteria bacterium CG08_land_8_20_14_0_20_33_29]PIW12371.1 MAG: septum formation initiator [Candidatus Atribacteria bacterium CG17_big_fil_post_rev_8_21_14_2_50_34_11]PIX35308.1 MAG: septum formation initiator [Candidatus Atribacteria bacterium CG_4_8_14_3_um_filter_34_18]PIY32897.1 MAG: septum formation initiator [Candidatus Atribacteria bacterium CG_4_10_14_3_um_filter_34_13]PJB57130.1 MAG: septum formation initiator [Candidatus Atribacteria 